MTKGIYLVLEGGGSGFRGLVVEDGTFVGPSGNISRAEATPENIAAFAKMLAGRAVAVGISISGFVDGNGVVTKSTNTGLPPMTPIAQMVSEATGLPTTAVNDLRAAGIGAAQIFPNLKNYACVNIGSGLGQCVIKDGQVVSDNEQGHMTIDLSPFARRCACGLNGCAESIIGGKALTRLVKWNADALGLALPTDRHALTFLDEEFVAEKEWADDVYNKFTLALGIYLANLQLGAHVPAIVWRGTTAQKALQLPSIMDWVTGSMKHRLPEKSWANIEHLFIPNRPDLPADYDALLGAAELASRLVT